MSNRLLRALGYLLLCGIGVLMAAPLVWMISTSLKAPGEALSFPPRWLPTRTVEVTIGGEDHPLATATVGGRSLRVAVLGQTPQGARVRVLASGEERVVPRSQVTPLRRMHFEWANYARAWTALRPEIGFLGLLHNADGFLVFYLNSIFVVVTITFGQVFTSSLAAFAFARLRFPGRDPIFLGYLGTLMVPGVVLMIPLFALFTRLRLTDTYWALILPGMFSAYGTFLLRQFFMTLPRDLEDAARMDGASPWRIYWSVILPLSKPALATLVTFTFLHYWNDFMWPLVVISDPGKKTLPLGLAQFQGPYVTEWSLLMAASVVVMVPVLLVFVAGQRYFIRGLVLSGLKA
jgi:multiple sugar transport system permease protein